MPNPIQRSSHYFCSTWNVERNESIECNRSMFHREQRLFWTFVFLVQEAWEKFIGPAGPMPPRRCFAFLESVLPYAELPELIQVVEDGEPVTICRRGMPVVDIVRTTKASGEKPRLGTLVHTPLEQSGRLHPPTLFVLTGVCRLVCE